MTSIPIRFVSSRLWAALVAGILLTVLHPVESAVINAVSASQSDITSAIGTAVDGDTVVIPAGTWHFTSQLAISKGITLQGAGNDTTVILDDVSRTGQDCGQAIKVTLAPGQTFRITGITFRYGSLSTNGSNGLFAVAGTSTSFRMDHCHFDQVYNDQMVAIAGWIYGVIDHCTFTGRANFSGAAILVLHATWGGGSNAYGDGSWADPPYFGSEKFIFIEDNVFNNLASNQTNAGIDCFAGGRYVVRHNTFNNTLPLNHGTESGGRLRGSRAIEIYNNTINFTFGATCGQNRGGAALYHDNVYTGMFNNNVLSQNCYREFYPFRTFGGASGNNLWDSNDSHGLYLSGTHTGPSNSQTLVYANAHWTANQWAGYTITNTTQTLSTGEHYSSHIISNTSDTITYHLDKTYGPYMTFNTGDRFVIYKVLIALDQPGRGQGDLISGAAPLNTTTRSVSWPHQALEPVYSWNNTVNGSPVTITSSYPTLQENRDYYNETPMPGYKPFVYPHPLVMDVPDAPSNLKIVPSS